MKNRSRGRDSLPSQLKHLVADMFRLDLVEPDKMAENEPLIGGSIGLDSLDAVELGMCIEETFGIAISGNAETQAAFASIASLAGFIRVRAAGGQVRPAQVRIIRRGGTNRFPQWSSELAPVAPALLRSPA